MSDFITNAELRIESERLCDENERLEAENAELRHDLEEANNQAEEVCIENAKLREQIHWLKKGDILHVLTEQEYIDQCERERLMQVSIDALDKENAKLREEIEAAKHDLQVFSRGSVQLEAENAKLRESVRRLMTQRDERLARAEAENAKLRELCAGLLTGYECGYGELCKGCTWDGIGDSKTFSCLPRVKARDLGVEVEE